MVETPVTPSARLLPTRREVVIRLPFIVTLALVGLVFIWVLFWAPKTTYGSAVSDPVDFLKVVFDSLTYAGLCSSSPAASR